MDGNYGNTIIINNSKKFRSFKSKENIHKKEVGPLLCFNLKKKNILKGIIPVKCTVCDVFLY